MTKKHSLYTELLANRRFVLQPYKAMDRTALLEAIFRLHLLLARFGHYWDATALLRSTRAKRRAAK